MKTGLCSTCTHWYHDDFYAGTGRGLCTLAHDLTFVQDDPVPMKMIPMCTAEPDALHDADAQLETAADFGCTLWEHRE